MTTVDYPIPAWRLILDGKDLTERVAPRLLEITLTEARGGEADQLDLVIHDHDGRMALPRRGVDLSFALGWRDAGLIDKGTFRVDEVEHSGAPDIITVRSRSADLTHKMRVRRERSWHGVTLGAIVRNLAGEHGLRANVAAALNGITVDHLDQANESDMNLLTRLGRRFDAIATVKAGTLLFAPIGSGMTATGKPLPAAAIRRAEGDQHRYSVVDRDTYSGVRAYWNDKAGARRKSVLVGDDQNAKQIRETYSSEKIAREHADAEFKRLKRGAARLEYTLAVGRADLYPEQHVTVAGFKPAIDGDTWLIDKLTHTVSGSSGFTTKLEMERAA